MKKINCSILLSVSISLVLFSGITLSEIYKCKDQSGKVSYKSEPCEENQSSSLLDVISSSKVSDNPTQNNKNTGPSGRWINSKKMTAYISQSGAFQMTDISGGILMGTWTAGNGGRYSVSAQFNGLSFPVKMKYDSQSDILYLSKPGFPDTLVKYNRN